MRAAFPGLLAFAALSGQQAQAALKAGDVVSFVACPVAQDTGPDSDLCFFTEYRGQRISLATPEFDTVGVMLKHKVLVEGRLASGPPDCGGLRVDGQISPLPELSLECNEVQPRDSKIPAPPDFTGPEEVKILSRLKANPALSVQPMFSGVPSYNGPPLLRWQMIYTFDSDRGDGTSLDKLVALVSNAVRTNAKAVLVRAFQDGARLDDGTMLQESKDMAERRARKIADIIAGLGFSKDGIRTSWAAGSQGAEPGSAWRGRRVEVEVVP